MSHLINMMGQLKKIKSGSGIQVLLDEAYKILGNPIAMCNTEYTLLAYTDAVTDDPVWNELIENRVFSKEMRIFFKDEGFVEEIANSQRSAVLKSDKLKYDRILGKLFNKNNSFVANLIIVACNKPFENDDAIVFEAVCKLISREITRIDFFQEYEQTHQETVIRNLIDGESDKELDISQVGIVYESLESHLYIAVVDISLCNPDNTNAVYFRDLLKQAEPSYKYSIYSEYIIIIMSTNDDALNINKAFKHLIEIFEHNNMYAGISSKFENLFELKKYYTEALEMMQHVSEKKSAQRIFPCNPKSAEAMKQIDAIENGSGIQYFLDRGAEIFGNPLLFHDMELNLLAYSKNMEIDDPIWQELITYGTSSYETIELFRSEGFIDIMDNTKGGAVLISEKIKYDRISWRIYNSDTIRIGCTSIVNTIKPFSDDELVLFGAFSQKFSKEVGKIEFYNNYGQLYSDTIINRLISGKIDDHTFYSEDIGNLYSHLMDNLYVVAVDTSQCDSKHINLTYFRNLLSRSNAVHRYAVYDNYIIIIVSTDDAVLTELNEFDEMSGVFEDNNIYAGISSRFEDIYELQKHYKEAVSALESGIKNKNISKKRIFQYDEAVTM